MATQEDLKSLSWHKDRPGQVTVHIIATRLCNYDILYGIEPPLAMIIELQDLRFTIYRIRNAQIVFYIQSYSSIFLSSLSTLHLQQTRV